MTFEYFFYVLYLYICFIKLFSCKWLNVLLLVLKFVIALLVAFHTVFSDKRKEIVDTLVSVAYIHMTQQHWNYISWFLHVWVFFPSDTSVGFLHTPSSFRVWNFIFSNWTQNFTFMSCTCNCLLSIQFSIILINNTYA